MSEKEREREREKHRLVVMCERVVYDYRVEAFTEPLFILVERRRWSLFVGDVVAL